MHELLIPRSTCAASIHYGPEVENGQETRLEIVIVHGERGIPEPSRLRSLLCQHLFKPARQLPQCLPGRVEEGERCFGSELAHKSVAHLHHVHRVHPHSHGRLLGRPSRYAALEERDDTGAIRLLGGGSSCRGRGRVCGTALAGRDGCATCGGCVIMLPLLLFP